MKAVRIILRQTSANYRKEETLENKMTYPLPPLSTVIGAIHNACGYREYHPMDISIQGKFESIHKEPYVDSCFFNSTQDDRGILVKMRNDGMLSKAFDKVASSKKNQGNSFRDQITIQIHNEKLMDEYLFLKDLGDQIKIFKNTRLKRLSESLKKRKKVLSDLKKLQIEDKTRYSSIIKREKEIKEIEKDIKERFKAFEYQQLTLPLSQYRSSVTSIKYYEVLNNITLILHVQAESSVMQDIVENIYNLKSIGRSEDFVQVGEIELVDLVQEKGKVISENSAYLDYDIIKNHRVFGKAKEYRSISGTKYSLNKDYSIEGHKRVFNKKKVVYLSQYGITQASGTIWLDRSIENTYIVNFL